MMACLDVHYGDNAACAAAVIFADWSDSEPLRWYSTLVAAMAAYEPGRFYLRELGPLTAVVKLIQEPIGVFVIDAYCYLSADKTPGLGAYLCDSINGPVAVIGVAKNRFRDARHAEEVLRGNSRRPLFVTAIRLPQQIAATRIASMSGRFRLPTLIKAVDQLARRGTGRS